MSSSLTAVSPDSNILAVYTPSSKDNSGSGSSSSSSSKIIIKCYDAKVSLGALKYTLSASTKQTAAVVDGILFASPRTLLASTGCGNNNGNGAKIFIFDLVRGVHAHTIDIPSGMHLQSIDAKDEYVYALVKKDGKSLVLKYDIGSDSTPKLVKKIKTGSCDDDDVLSVCIAGDNDSDNKGEGEESVAVRIGNKIKIVNSSSGDSEMKFKIKSKDADTYTHTSSAVMEVSSDGGLIIASTSNALHLFSGSGSGSSPDKNKSASARSSIGVAKIPNATKVYIHTIQSGKEYIVSCCSNDVDGNGNGNDNGKSSSEATLLHIMTGGSKKTTNVKSFASITPLSSMTSSHKLPSSSLLAFFAQQEIIMAELTMVGFTNVNVQMTRLSYRNDDDDDDNDDDDTHDTKKGALKSGNLYPTENDEDDDDAAMEDADADIMTSSSSKKRKKNIVLGPGESGGEALTVTDSTKPKPPSNKKSKKNSDSDSDDMEDFALEDEEGDEDGDGNGTIAERLALLSSELEREDSDEDEYLLRNGDANGNGNTSTTLVNGSSTKFIVKAATSDSLVILLRQALLANDDSQLEVALQVSDKRVIENSILELSRGGYDSGSGSSTGTAEDGGSGNGEVIVVLLTKLVTRISRKPARAQQLSFWIRTVLVALLSSSNSNSNSEDGDGFSMGKAERDIASRLAPLRSMLSERVESLPALLRLEGRLGLIGKQF